MKKSGLADSPLFSMSGNTMPKPVTVNPPKVEEEKSPKPSSPESEAPSNRDTMTPSNRDTTVSRYHDTIIETVRKAVKGFGKEAATHRFTVEEKKAIADILYSYKNLGIITHENEVTRIAINFIINNYYQNGENSILDQVLKALND
jgi:hypothetical protein